MGRSTFSFKGIEDALEEIAKHLVPAGPYFKDEKPSFGELIISGVEEEIFGTYPNKEVKRAPLSWKLFTKGEGDKKNGYIIYLVLRQERWGMVGKGGKPDGFFPDYDVNYVLQWFADNGLQLCPLKKKGLDRFRDYTHQYYFHIVPLG